MALNQALSNCVIDFDQRVLVTELLQEYNVSYEEAHEALAAHILTCEKRGTKYLKRFLVHGKEQQSNNEVYTVVQGETNLQSWLSKLKNAESTLYSVEVVGGAKTAAPVFKPMRRCVIELQHLELRTPAVKTNVAVASASTVLAAAAPLPERQEVKLEKKVPAKTEAKLGGPARKSDDTTPTSYTNSSTDDKTKKTTSENKKSPKGEKKTAGKAMGNNKKGVTSFFQPVQKEDKSDTKITKPTGVIKPTTPKKMQDFFKKHTEKPTPPEKEQPASKQNTSVQLFAEEDIPTVDSDSSSDEEQKLEALKRDIITSDNENDVGPCGSKNSKRRRIEDSDDEDEPQQKHDKLDEKDSSDVAVVDAAEEQQAEPATFLDEEGFVITIKPKKSKFVRKPTKPSPPKPAAKEPTTAKSNSAAATPVAKTKQGNIMSFFSKK